MLAVEIPLPASKHLGYCYRTFTFYGPRWQEKLLVKEISVFSVSGPLYRIRRRDPL